MAILGFRQEPWTCRWGRFGVTVEQRAAASARVDDVFWACHHPARPAGVHVMHRRQCAECPLWELAPRLVGRDARPDSIH